MGQEDQPTDERQRRTQQQAIRANPQVAETMQPTSSDMISELTNQVQSHQSDVIKREETIQQSYSPWGRETRRCEA